MVWGPSCTDYRGEDGGSAEGGGGRVIEEEVVGVVEERCW